jgi:hypothetical protein
VNVGLFCVSLSAWSQPNSGTDVPLAKSALLPNTALLKFPDLGCHVLAESQEWHSSPVRMLSCDFA